MIQIRAQNGISLPVPRARAARTIRIILSGAKARARKNRHAIRGAIVLMDEGREYAMTKTYAAKTLPLKKSAAAYSKILQSSSGSSLDDSKYLNRFV